MRKRKYNDIENINWRLGDSFCMCVCVSANNFFLFFRISKKKIWEKIPFSRLLAFDNIANDEKLKRSKMTGEQITLYECWACDSFV